MLVHFQITDKANESRKNTNSIYFNKKEKERYTQYEWISQIELQAKKKATGYVGRCHNSMVT